MNDGQHNSHWDSDPERYPGTLKIGVWQHIAVIVDAGPSIISFVVHGILNDCDLIRQYGWGCYLADLGDVNGSSTEKAIPTLYKKMRNLRMYDRYLRTSEAILNFRAGL